MINVFCVYSWKSVHVLFSWSSQRWFRISDSLFPRMLVGTFLTSPGSSPQKIYKPLRENAHHKSFLAVISFLMWIRFCFFCPKQVFCLGSFFTMIFSSHPLQKWKVFSATYLLPRNPIPFLSNPTGGGNRGLQGAMMPARLDTQYYLQGLVFGNKKIPWT